MDLQKLMQQAQQMQSGLKNVQDELAEREISASAGGDKVTATVSCAGQLKSLKIDPSIVDPEDTSFLQELILEAVQNALDEGKKISEAEMGKLTGGMGMPGLF